MGRSEPLLSLLEWLRGAPPGTTILAAAMAEALANVGSATASAPREPVPLSWREKLWLVPAETRLGVREVAEKSEKAPLPPRKLAGELVFTAGELRAWIEGHETIIVAALRKSA